jgi:hypothetical protein
VDSESTSPSGRRQEIGTRLGAVRARLDELRERDRDAVRSYQPGSGERMGAAHRHAAEARAAANLALASSAEAFRSVADAHERVARVHERAAVSGLGDVRQHERQAAMHRAAAVAERERADRAESLIRPPEGAKPAPGQRESSAHGPTPPMRSTE